MSAVAIVGGGVMGQTVLAGLLRSGTDPSTVVVVEKVAERAEEVRAQHGVRVSDDLGAVRGAGTVLLAVKPQDMAAALEALAPHVEPDALVVSIAAGITTAAIEARLAPGTAVVRVMPNTPSLVDMGKAGVSAGSACRADHLEQARSMMASVGRVVEVPEDLQDAVTAVSGSGPAYLLLVVEAMVAAGVELGLSPEASEELVVQTVLGAATMLRATGEDPAVLRQRVTSPGGTTAAALAVLEGDDLRGLFARAMTAARDRSRELAG